MTDHDSLTGAVRFAHAARDAGVKPIFGAELTVLEEGGDRDRERRPTDHITLIAKDKIGYANLCHLISDAHLSNERDKPHTTFAKIAERAEGLFVLSGCERGEVARLAGAGRMPDAIAAARRWRDAIGEGYRIEVFDHRGYGHRTLRDRLLGIATETGIPAVATNDVHYPGPWDAGTHELLHAIREIVPLSATQSLRRTSEYYLKDPREMAALFADHPEVLGEALRIVDDCEFELELGVYHFPNVPLPKGETAAGLLARRSFEGLYRRFDTVTRTVENRLQHELNTIFHMGWPAYFLLVADIVGHTRTNLGIRCACRGSAAGSLVCYVLGISDVDPVRYDLLFERFMNTRREELPDIDIDVESHRREEVLAHILDTYGSDQVAMCCMVDTFRARMAIREVGKALGIPAEEIDLVAKAFPRVRAKDIPAAIERLPELSGSNLDAGQLGQLFELCIAIDGFPRHLALHPSGVILSSPDLADRVPMQESFQGFTMLQADKDDVEELGLAKLDILGIRMLSAIAHASDEIERTGGARHDLEGMPRDDPATFELIRSSKTLGCFQIESPGQRELLARFLPNLFEDLLVDISLFRPGPVKADMVSPFLDRRHGFEEVRYAHPCLEPILAETHGVVVYHEQVIRVIAAVTGCSLDDADYVRRHLDAERPAAPDDPDSRAGRKDGSGVPLHRDRGASGATGKKSDIGLTGSAVSDERLTRTAWRSDERLTNTQGDSREMPPRAARGKSHPGMGRGFRELPETIALGAEWLGSSPETGGTAFSLSSYAHSAHQRNEKRIGEDWERDQRAHFHGVAGPIEVTPPKDDVAGWFISSAIGNGFTERQARALWKEVFAFASFGFCKSHAAAFALPTYISAWLKTHYPAHFFAGVLTHDPGMYPRRLIVADARQFGIPILPIDVNASDKTYRVEQVPHPARGAEGVSDILSATTLLTDTPASAPSTNYGIRLALSEVRGISDAEIDSILGARTDRLYESLEDFWRRTEVSRPVLENLVHVGAFDEIQGSRSRRELLWRAIDLSGEPKPAKGEQMAFTLDEPIHEHLPGLRPYSPLEETEAEIEVSGIDARRHVMDLYLPLLVEMGCTPADKLARLRNNSEVWVAGVKVASQTPAIRSGQRIIFVTLDDLTGPIDVTIFERVQARCARTVFHSWLLLVKGVVRKRGGASLTHPTHARNAGLTVVVDEAFDLAELAHDRAEGHSLAAALGRQRRKQAVASLSPDGGPTGRLWHASGGSAGR